MKKLLILLLLPPFFTFAQPTTPTAKDDAQINVFISDMVTIPEVGAKIVMKEAGSGKLFEGTTDSTGLFSVLVKQGKKFDITVKQYGLDFQFGEKEIPVVGGPLTLDMKFKIGVDTIYQDIYTLENVYFDTDKATLKPESDEALGGLYKDLRNNPNMVVEIAGHTDNEGSESHNLNLSQRRAQAVRQYLIEKGIPEARIKAKGYGEHAPIADNSTPEGRAKNRRTEVRVIVK